MGNRRQSDDSDINHLLKSNLATQAFQIAQKTDVFLRESLRRSRQEQSVARSGTCKDPPMLPAYMNSYVPRRMNLIHCTSLPKERKSHKEEREHVPTAPNCYFFEEASYGEEHSGDVYVARDEYDSWVKRTAPFLPAGGSQPSTPQRRRRSLTKTQSLPTRPYDYVSQLRARRAFRKALPADSATMILRVLDPGDGGQFHFPNLQSLCSNLKIAHLLTSKDLADLHRFVRGNIAELFVFLDLSSIPSKPLDMVKSVPQRTRTIRCGNPGQVTTRLPPI